MRNTFLQFFTFSVKIVNMFLLHLRKHTRYIRLVTVNNVIYLKCRTFYLVQDKKISAVRDQSLKSPEIKVTESSTFQQFWSFQLRKWHNTGSI